MSPRVRESPSRAGDIDIRAGGRFHSQPGRLHVQTVVELLILSVHVNRRAGGGFELGRASDMVDVRVRDHDGLHSQPVAAQHGENVVDLVTWVDDDGFAGGFLAENRAVALEHSYGQNLVNHLSPNCSTCEGGLNSSVLKIRGGSPGGEIWRISATCMRGPWK